MQWENLADCRTTLGYPPQQTEELLNDIILIKSFIRLIESHIRIRDRVVDDLYVILRDIDAYEDYISSLERQ